MQLSKTIIEALDKALNRLALEDALMLWADEYLPGRPQILAAAVYSNMEQALKRTLENATIDIEQRFPVKE